LYMLCVWTECEDGKKGGSGCILGLKSCHKLQLGAQTKDLVGWSMINTLMDLTNLHQARHFVWYNGECQGLGRYGWVLGVLWA
jgi:hypothetical protein